MQIPLWYLLQYNGMTHCHTTNNKRYVCYCGRISGYLVVFKIEISSSSSFNLAYDTGNDFVGYYVWIVEE